MIARIFIIILIITILPDIYLDRRMLRRRTRYLWWQRILWWLPCIILCAYTIFLASSRNFAPDNNTVLNVYLFLIGFIIIPKFLYALCSLLGWLVCRLFHSHNNWGNLIGLFLAIFIMYLVAYGSTIGFKKLDIRHIDYYSQDLPEAFEGYRIVHISDLHVGTYGNNTKPLERIVDSINAQKPDLIAFTGDLQNMQPKELYPFISILSKMQANDGVYSVLGNHDYADYIKADDVVKVANEREIISRERQFGWNLLLNENKVIQRDNNNSTVIVGKNKGNQSDKKSSIVIAGMENDGRPPFPQKGDINKTLSDVKDGSFIIMLEHDPTSWRRNILPNSNVQLTLSGHTHATQFKIFGWSPASLIYKEWGGIYFDDDRALNVSVGAGGFIPYRFGASNEIVVITLHKK
ncbi:MAG: metallophosphoesterase [Prevotella sp.]|nr:metallophosphoesterase [Prevotella sp.]